MRRSGIVLLVALALTALSPLVATAKKPVERSVRYQVDIASIDGVVTSCTETLETVRTETPGGSVHYESAGAILEIVDGAGGNGYEIAPGCHGSLAALEYFRITLEPDGSIAILWIFDIEHRDTVRMLKNGRTKISTSRTDFRMGGPYTADGDTAVWDRTISTIDGKDVIGLAGTGQFNFVHYDSAGHEEFADEPLFVNVGNTTATLKLTLREL